MSYFQEINDFAYKANRINKLDDLQSLLDDITRSLGFNYFALVHHVDLNALPGGAVSLMTYPDTWREALMARRYFIDDPVLSACEKTAVGFSWSEVGKFIELTPRHRMILEMANAEGLGDGFTVPVHVPGDFSGSCSFGIKSGGNLPRASFPAAQYLGCFAFEAARRIARNAAKSRIGPDQAPQLTDRQYDCVLLAARGFNERETAILLDVKPDTVHKHMEEAKRRYGATCKTQLIVKALFNSQLSFSDIMQKSEN